ncbi:shikimate dehydrogenase [Marininema halotolerans]|uniref:Shikimate dehydrogenase (NADP(+)) n=1 Tax=Marininema halotolerans TaxID=1155944 RepID=A0A1I6RYH1_9BACL|nr:shikimate dehydrogenase [Marininema halotolerans]SFS69538.1 shikimate dehydrogenase [Marininema halotolerans]
MVITGTVGKVGLIGHPVGHSKSPEIWNDAFENQEIPYIYLPFDVSTGDLGSAVSGLKSLGFRGFNVTIPHKVSVMNFLDEIEEEAVEIGAVNTVINDGGRLIGTNTDGEGYIQSLQSETGLTLAGQHIVLLGAGGAARAVGTALAKAGAAQITIANRTMDKAEALASRLQRWTRTNAILLEQIASPLQDASLLVQTTSVGMSPNKEACPIDPELLHSDLLVSDLIYHPRQTRLLKEAKIRGARVHSGLGMLVHQAALAYQRWIGKDAPIKQMMETLDQSLKNE